LNSIDVCTVRGGISMSGNDMDWLGYWQALFERGATGGCHLDQLVEDGYAVLDEALPMTLYTALQREGQDAVGYQAAKISGGGRLDAIRSDATRWIEAGAECHGAGSGYVTALEGLGQYLNQSLYLGVRSVEAHYACYQSGQFYAQHRDNPQGSTLRAISTVLYLNGESAADWPEVWGGALRLIDSHRVAREALPIANRLVIFNSDLLHEVLPATQVRRSIAGWLRRDTAN
jgi:SM-20-related protein